jgi:hypothetical protein
VGMDVAVTVEDMAGVETERLGSGVGDLGDIISFDGKSGPDAYPRSQSWTGVCAPHVYGAWRW